MVARRSVVRTAVAALIVDDKGRLLTGVRCGKRGNGRIAVPGGAIDFGETIKAAAKREVLEETNLNVTILPYSKVQTELFVTEHVDGDDHFITLFVEARIIGGELQNCEPDRCEGWEWLTYDRLASRIPREAIEAWQNDQPHEALAWIPLPHLAYYREHLGLR